MNDSEKLKSIENLIDRIKKIKLPKKYSSYDFAFIAGRQNVANEIFEILKGDKK